MDSLAKFEQNSCGEVETSFTCVYAFEKGHARCCDNVVLNRDGQYEYVHCMRAAYYGHLECLKQLHEKGFKWDF